MAMSFALVSDTLNGSLIGCWKFCALIISFSAGSVFLIFQKQNHKNHFNCASIGSGGKKQQQKTMRTDAWWWNRWERQLVVLRPVNVHNWYHSYRCDSQQFAMFCWTSDCPNSASSHRHELIGGRTRWNHHWNHLERHRPSIQWIEPLSLYRSMLCSPDLEYLWEMYQLLIFYSNLAGNLKKKNLYNILNLYLSSNSHKHLLMCHDVPSSTNRSVHFVRYPLKSATIVRLFDSQSKIDPSFLRKHSLCRTIDCPHKKKWGMFPLFPRNIHGKTKKNNQLTPFLYITTICCDCGLNSMLSMPCPGIRHVPNIFLYWLISSEYLPAFSVASSLLSIICL